MTRFLATLLAAGAAASVLTCYAVVAVIRAAWAALNPEVRADLLQFNWAMVGTLVLLLIVCPALMSLADRNR